MEKLKEIIGDARTVGITGHTRPDGDCIGSCIGTYNYIIKNFPDVDVRVYLEYVDDKFKLIDNTDKIITTGYDGTEFDLFIALDSGDTDRLGINKPFFENAKRTLCVDHHISNKGFADINYILPKSSSACEVLYDLLDDECIDLATAKAMYMGIAHDSGCFRYSSTSPNTMRVAANLMEKGIDVNELLEKTYYSKSYEQQQITAKLMLDSKRIVDGKCIYSYATKELMDRYGVTNHDLDAVVSELRNIQGVECAVFMYELGPNHYKVSMRSNTYVDVSKVAVEFGGGGHIRAAGFDTDGTAEEIIDKVTSKLEVQIREIC
ncbi:MAG: bifunctional oligoribonuclease/PAP phosphatase NrnA [Lachnospiraceae bacterium]|nr:bifunctional oligoribonuclease/PAP phosphatase NrnA [Lachnospiraceae bacterium]